MPMKNKLQVFYVCGCILLLSLACTTYFGFGTKKSLISPAPVRQDINLIWERADVSTASIARKEHSLTFNESYMVSLVYAEQFTNAFIHYNEFLSLATRWNFTGVEPFVKNSRISGFQALNSDSIDIRHLLDMELFREKYAAKCVADGANRSDLIKPMSLFLQNSFREVVVVYFSKHMFVLPREVHKKMDSLLVSTFSQNNSTAIITCTQLAAQSLTPAVEDVLKREQSKFGSNVSLLKEKIFTVREVLCVNPKPPLSLVQLMNHIVDYLHSTGLKASVLFVSWQGKYTRKFTDLATMSSCVLPFTQVPFSSVVKKNAKEFLQSKTFVPNNYISLHVRFEKLFEFAFNQRKSNQSAFYHCCMKRLELTLEALSNKTHTPLNQTMFLNDYGNHGTDSCHYHGHWNPSQVCIKETKKMLGMLSVNASEYTSLQGGEDNSGLVSLIEEVSLFEGRLLVTVGSGTFQSALVKRFVDYHSNSTYSATDLHYHVCLNEKLNGLKISSPIC